MCLDCWSYCILILNSDLVVCPLLSCWTQMALCKTQLLLSTSFRFRLYLLSYLYLLLSLLVVKVSDLLLIVPYITLTGTLLPFSPCCHLFSQSIACLVLVGLAVIVLFHCMFNKAQYVHIKRHHNV